MKDLMFVPVKWDLLETGKSVKIPTSAMHLPLCVTSTQTVRTLKDPIVAPAKQDISEMGKSVQDFARRTGSTY